MSYESTFTLEKDVRAINIELEFQFIDALRNTDDETFEVISNGLKEMIKHHADWEAECSDYWYKKGLLEGEIKALTNHPTFKL